MSDQPPPPDDAPLLDDREPFYKRTSFVIAAVIVIVILGFATSNDPEPVPVEPVAAEVVTETVTERVDPDDVDDATLARIIEAGMLDEAERRTAVLDSREDRLRKLSDRLDDREAELARREDRLDKRERRIAGAEQQQAANTFTNGTWLVGDDIEPGTYRTDGGSGCYWARLSGVGGGLGDIITNGNTSGPEIVEIAASDTAFETTGGCEWVRQ